MLYLLKTQDLVQYKTLHLEILCMGPQQRQKFPDHVTQWADYTRKAWHVFSGKMELYPNNQESTL